MSDWDAGSEARYERHRELVLAARAEQLVESELSQDDPGPVAAAPGRASRYRQEGGEPAAATCDAQHTRPTGRCAPV
jgi:hypothetical protein